MPRPSIDPLVTHLAHSLGCRPSLIAQRQQVGVLPDPLTDACVAAVLADHARWLDAISIAEAAACTDRHPLLVQRLVRTRILTPVPHALGGRERIARADLDRIRAYRADDPRPERPLLALQPHTTPEGWLRIADVAVWLGTSEGQALRVCTRHTTLRLERHRYLISRAEVERLDAAGAFNRIGHRRLQRRAAWEAQRARHAAAPPRLTYAQVARDLGYTRQYITSLVKLGKLAWPPDPAALAAMRRREHPHGA